MSIPAPILITGMHHSGTGLLTKLLRLSGLWLVPDMSHEETRLFTLQLNNELIMGKEWARYPIMPLEEVSQHQAKFDKFLDKKLPTFFKKNSYDGNQLWGFKDPRICVLLPLYLHRFPEAQVVHIVRDAEAVAISLANSRKLDVGQEVDLEKWRRLRAAHVNRVREVMQNKEANYHELAYEALVQSPTPTLAPLLDTLNLTLTPELKGVIATDIYQHRLSPNPRITPISAPTLSQRILNKAKHLLS